MDNTFSGDGIQTTAIGNNGDIGYSVAIQKDNKIVVAGYSYNGTNLDFALARFNSDGSLDNTFSGDGKQTTDISSGNDKGYSVAIQTDGKIVVAGYTDNGTIAGFALVRYYSNGTLDNTFSGDGIQTTVVRSYDQGYSVAIQTDGKILVAGQSDLGFAAVRYKGVGAVDIQSEIIRMKPTFFVFPNPTNCFLTIQSPNTPANLPYSIIDQSGRELLKGSLNTKTTTLDISTLASGFYFLQVGEFNKETFKLMKQ